MKFTDLPTLGAPLEGGTFAGITTKPDGTHVAVVLLPERGEDMNYDQAVAWAEEQGAQLPTRHVAALLFSNVQPLLQSRWHWCLETDGASYAWRCGFSSGNQSNDRKSFDGSAVAVRLIHVS